MEQITNPNYQDSTFIVETFTFVNLTMKSIRITTAIVEETAKTIIQEACLEKLINLTYQVVVEASCGVVVEPYKDFGYFACRSSCS